MSRFRFSVHVQGGGGKNVDAGNVVCGGGVGAGLKTCAWRVNIVTQKREARGCRRMSCSFASKAYFGRVGRSSRALSFDPPLPLQCRAWQASGNGPDALKIPQRSDLITMRRS